MPTWPWTIPIDAWAGLNTAAGEVTAAGYAREPVTLEQTDDPTVIANAETIEWPTASALWGTIVAVSVWDIPVGGTQLFAAPCPLFAISQYERPRVQAGTLIVTNPANWGYGRRGFGRGGFGVGNATSGDVPFGLWGFGLFGFGTGPHITAQTILERTFDPAFLCGGTAPTPGYGAGGFGTGGFGYQSIPVRWGTAGPFGVAA